MNVPSSQAHSFRDRVQDLAMTGEAVLALSGIEAFRGGRDHALIRCPAHEDEHPSCSVHLATGRARCFACGFRAGDSVALHHALGHFSSMGEALRDLESRCGSARPPLILRPAVPRDTGPSVRVNGRPESVKAFPYCHADGTLAFTVERIQWRQDDGSWVISSKSGKPAKTYRPLSPDGSRRMPEQFNRPFSRPIYRLADVMNAPGDRTIVVVEGEPAADALASAGEIATTSSGGASTPRLTDWRPLAGQNVILWPDNDAPGREYMRGVATLLHALEPPPNVVLVDVSTLGLPPGGDAVDWLKTRGTP